MFAIKHYDNPQAVGEKEFYDDMKRFKYLKRLFKKHSKTGILKERLIMNHIIVLQSWTRILVYSKNVSDIFKLYGNKRSEANNNQSKDNGSIKKDIDGKPGNRCFYHIQVSKTIGDPIQ